MEQLLINFIDFSGEDKDSEYYKHSQKFLEKMQGSSKSLPQVQKKEAEPIRAKKQQQEKKKSNLETFKDELKRYSFINKHLVLQI